VLVAHRLVHIVGNTSDAFASFLYSLALLPFLLLSLPSSLRPFERVAAINECPFSAALQSKLGQFHWMLQGNVK
jgi:hypothetical protein